MSLSTNAGASRTRIDTSINPGNSLEWEAVRLSDEGARVVAVLNGPIYFSANTDTRRPPSARRPWWAAGP